MNGLRRIILLLSVALAAVIARMVIDGPKLLGGLTGALIVVLLQLASPEATGSSTPAERLVRDRASRRPLMLRLTPAEWPEPTSQGPVGALASRLGAP